MPRRFFTTRFFPILAAIFFAVLLSPVCMAAEEVIEAASAAHEEHEALPLYASELFRIGSFVVTNSMFVTWVVAAAIIIFARFAMRNVQPIPSGAQNFWEWLVESLYNFLESIVGKELVKKTFWFFGTIFIFILFVNWCGLIPGVGTIGWGQLHAKRRIRGRPSALPWRKRGP